MWHLARGDGGHSSLGSVEPGASIAPEVAWFHGLFLKPANLTYRQDAEVAKANHWAALPGLLRWTGNPIVTAFATTGVAAAGSVAAGVRKDSLPMQAKNKQKAATTELPGGDTSWFVRDRFGLFIQLRHLILLKPSR